VGYRVAFLNKIFAPAPPIFMNSVGEMIRPEATWPPSQVGGSTHRFDSVWPSWATLVRPSRVTSVRMPRMFVITLYKEINLVPEHLGPKDFAGCWILRDLLVCMEWTHLRAFLPQRIGQYKRCKIIFLASTSKYLLTIKTLYQRFVGFLLSLKSQDFGSGSVSQD